MSSKRKIELFLYRIKLFSWVIKGEISKFLIDTSIFSPQPLTIGCKKNIPNVIVSLTTYGRRVEKVYYTIISLLRQTMKPDMVILWLDSDNWNENNIPDSLRKLQEYGLTIRFCKDLKSYKKLIPALQEFPEAMIITCDDDIYYRRNMVERLVNAYKKDPTKIYAHRAHRILFNEKGIVKSYNDWPEEISDECGRFVFPTSGGGTLYTKKLLYKDMCNEELFMKLSPKADDVWNYFMGYLQGTENVVLPHKGYIYLPLDVIYQFFHKGSNLSSSNCNECMNDVQIKAIMDYYNIKFEDHQN